MAKKEYIGKRKQSIAKIYPKKGTGKFFINGKTINEYLPSFSLIVEALLPLKVTDNYNKYDFEAKVYGGGIAGQAGAIKNAIAKYLVEEDPKYRTILRKHKLLTRDSRVKERKKYGLKKARKSPQFSKR